MRVSGPSEVLGEDNSPNHRDSWGRNRERLRVDEHSESSLRVSDTPRDTVGCRSC